MPEVSKKIEFLYHPSADGWRNVIKKLLARDNINISELARGINQPQPTIHRLLTGKTEDPKISTLTLIADYFSITMDQLLGLTPLTNEPGKKSLTAHSVPILSWQDALTLKKLIPGLSANNWENWVLIDAQASAFSFGLKSRKCMEPRFPAGSILIVDPGLIPDDGDLVVVSYPGIIEATVRELVLDGPHRELTSITGGTASDKLTNDIKVLGVVIQTRFSYK